MHPLIPVHVVAGSIALIAGAAALSLRKGSPMHGRAGTWFFGSMLTMAGTGAVIALAMPERGTATIGVLTCYLVATSWAAARGSKAFAGAFEAAAMLVALACCAAFVALYVAGAAEPDNRLDELPAGVHLPFAALAGLAAALDLNLLRRGSFVPNQRIARHLWRMCAAFLIAAMSFFLGQQKVLPEFVRGSPILFLPPLAILATMTYWIFRMRFGRGLRRAPKRAAAALLPDAAAAPAE